MSIYWLFLAFVVAVAVISLVWAAIERHNERTQTAAIFDGYSHAARCSCGWEIGAEDPDDAADMLALHRAVKPHPDLLDIEWQQLSTLACKDWPSMPDDSDLPRTW